MTFATMILFAADGDARIAVLSAVFLALGGAIAKVLDFAWGWIKESRGEQKEDKKSITDHLTARVNRLEAEGAQKDERDRRTRKRVRRLENTNTQMLAHILYMERIARSAKPPLDFDPFKEIPLPEDDTCPVPGTDTHNPLPQTGGT